MLQQINRGEQTFRVIEVTFRAIEETFRVTELTFRIGEIILPIEIDLVLTQTVMV